MDSGSSGSMQSSSGGDEEYESRPESLPPFLGPSSHFDPLPNQQPSLLPHQQHHTLFHPSPNIFHAFSQPPPNPTSSSSLLVNFDVFRLGSLRSEPTCSEPMNNLPGSSSSPLSLSQSILGGQGSSQQVPPLSAKQLRSVDEYGAHSSPPPDQTRVPARNPKKRTRASRRAPTTVLTTDTTNFRAMVQEFTGLPAPPFSGSPFSCSFDLFGSGMGLKSGHLELKGSLYPLRPSAQKVHQKSPFVFPSFLSNTIGDTSNIVSTISTNSNNAITTPVSAAPNTVGTSSINYQLSSDLSLPKQHQNMMNMQNQMLSIQSNLQSPPLHPSLHVAGLGAKSQTNFPISSLEELGVSHGNINPNHGGLPSQVTTRGMQVMNENSWNDGVRSNHENQDHHLLRSFDGNYGNLQHANSCELNY